MKYIFKNRKKCSFIIGASWNTPTNLIIAILIFFKIFKKANFFLWSESNHKSLIFKSKIFSLIRKFFFSQFNNFIIPGEVANKSIKKILGNNQNSNFFLLPNIVNEKKFKPNSKYKKYDEVIAFWPARLHEKSKGIINFLIRVKDIILKNTQIQNIDSWRWS